MADLSSSLAALLQVPGLSQLLNQAVLEQQQSLPLRTAVRQQAMNMLPNSAFADGTRPDLGSLPISAATGGGIGSLGPNSSPTDWPKILGLLSLGIGGGGVIAKALGVPGATNLGALVNALRGATGSNVGPLAGGDNPGNALNPNPPPALDPNYTPPTSGGDFNFGVGGGNASGPDLDAFSFFNPTVVQNPANPNADAFGGAPVSGPNQTTAARRTFGGPLGVPY